MAAPSGSGDIQKESSSTSNDSINTSSKSLQPSNTEEVSTNGNISCTVTGPQTSSNLLRPSEFSSSSTSSFGHNVSSSTVGATQSPIKFGHSSSTNPFTNSSQPNPFKLRPSVFVTADKEPVVKRPVILRASQLEPVVDSSVSSSTSNLKSFVLSPAKLNNPLLKTTNNVQDGDNGSISSTSQEKGEIASNDTTEKADGVKVSFVPLVSSSAAESSSHTPTPAPASNTSVPGFVFGQNLLDRVEVAADLERNNTESSEANSSEPSTCHGESSKTNGTTPEMLFSSVLQKELPDKLNDTGNDERKRKSLSEAAREYEESRAIKRKYEEVTVKTGEEEEINILQINCKLFAFNTEKSTWVERGRGTLRVNDLLQDNRTQSRVVMRVSGSLRVVLNTKIWAEMAVDRPSEKSVRLTAMDSLSGEIKVFLVMAGVKEIDQLMKALEWRVNNQKKLASCSEKSNEVSES